MEEIYVNVNNDKPVFSCRSTNQTGPRSSERRFYRPVVLCLVLPGVFLVTGLIGLGVHHHNSVHRAEAELFTIKANMTEFLQDSKNKLSSLTAEKDQLNARLSSLTREKDQLNVTLSSLTAEKDQLNARLSSLTREKDQLNVTLSFLTAEKDQLNASLLKVTEDRDRMDRLNGEKETCPAGWTMFSSSCYILTSESGSWTKDREDCRHRGADLVVIDSAKEQRFLSGFAKVDSWIGLSDGDIEGTWKWTDGSPLSLKNWEEYEPNNGGKSGNEDCVQIRVQKGVWNDLPCDTSLRSICEKIA